MAELVSEIHEQVPLVQRVFDVIEDKGAVLVASELCEHGTLWDAMIGCSAGKITHVPWLVCEVHFPPAPLLLSALCQPLEVQA